MPSFNDFASTEELMAAVERELDGEPDEERASLFRQTIEEDWRQTAGTSSTGYYVALWINEWHYLRSDKTTKAKWRITLDTEERAYELVGSHEKCLRLFEHLKKALWLDGRDLSEARFLDFFPPSDAEQHAGNELFGRFG